jgi:hypothetical protein
MEQRPSREAASCAANEELLSILWNPEVHYCVHKSPPLVPILSQIIQSVSSYPISQRSHLRLGLPNGHFPSGFPTNILYSFLLSSIHSTCPDHLIVLDLFILIIFSKEYKLWSFTLCTFLQSPVTSSLFGPNILNTLSLCSSLNVRDQVSHPYRTKGKL